LSNTTPNDTTKQELQNTTPSGNAPRRRLATAEAAAAIYQTFDLADTDAALSRAILQGMIDGNPPYKQAELDELGLGDMVNVNFLTMRANLDARAAAAHELFIEVPTLLECQPKITADDSPDAFTYCSIIAEEFTQLLRDWPEFLPSMDRVIRESDAFGVGFLLWPDEYDWQFKAYRRANLRFDPHADVAIDKNDVVMCKDEYDAGTLYDIMQDEALATKRGWKVANVKKLLVDTFITGQSDKDEEYQGSTWESLQTMCRNNDKGFQEKQFAKVRVVHQLVREVAPGGKISHYIIPETESHQVFLYEAHDRFERMDHVAWWLPYNYGNGYIASVRGVASYMAPHDDLSNRFLGRVFDAGFLSAGFIMQPTTQGDLSRLQFVQHGPYTILPPDLKLHQSTFSPQIAPLIQLRSVSEDVMKNNTGTYRQHSEGLDGTEVQKTARQVIEETSKEARYEKAAIAHRYTLLDNLYRELMRRVLRKEYLDGEAKHANKELAKEFVARCKKRGVPVKYLNNWDKNFRVAATRALGLGSLGVKYDITNQLMSARDGMDEAGRHAVLRDWVAVRVGQGNVDKYVPPMNRDATPGNQHSIAQLENNDMMEGSSVTVGQDQRHAHHLAVHLPLIQQIVEAVESGQPLQDPATLARGLQQLLPHSGQHIQALAPDQTRAAFVKEAMQLLQIGEQTLKRLVRIAEQQAAQAQAEAEAQAAAQQGDQDREFMQKVGEANRKLALEEANQDSLHRMRERKTDEALDQKREDAKHRRELEAEAQAAELRQNAELHAAKLAQARAK